MSTLANFGIIFALIVLNGIFVAAEFAIIGVRATRIEQLAEEGNRIAKRLRAILNDPAKVDRYIASAQLGITLASLGLGMYGEPVIAHLIEGPLHDLLGLEGDIVHTIGFLLGLTIITYLHVVLGEMIPKSLALQNAEGAVLVLAAPMILMQTLFAYPIAALNRLGLAVLRLLRVPPPSKDSRLSTPDELERIISESVVEGLIEVEEQAIISNIFDFGDLRAAQLMTPRPKIDAVPVTISAEALLEKMVASPHTRLPVYDGNLDNIIGVVHLKDLVHQHLEKTPYQLCRLLREVPFVPESMPADNLLSLLKKEHVHMAIVIDEFGGTAGLVTLEDLIEEIVGDVRDEFDTEEQEAIQVVGPGHIIAQGTVRLDEIRDYVAIGDYDVASIGGLLINQLTQLPPTEGDEVHLDGVTLRVEAVEGMAVARVSIHFAPPDDAPHPREH